MAISIYQAIKIFVSTVVLAGLLDMLITRELRSSSYSSSFIYSGPRKPIYLKVFEFISGKYTLDFIASRTLLFPLAELALGVSVVLSIYNVGFSLLLLPKLIFAVLFVLLLVVPLSLRETLTPHVITFTGTFLGIASGLVNGLSGVVNAFWGVVVGFGIYFLFYQLGILFSRMVGREDTEAFGGGAVYAMAMTGAYCGFPGVLSAVLFTALGSGIAALLSMLYLTLIKKYKRASTMNTMLPLTPFIVASGAVVIYILPLL